MQSRDPNHLRGVDVSWYQGKVDWPKVHEAGYRFAFVKVSEGSTMTDANYAVNLTGAKTAGMAVSGYHFLHARTPKEAATEAKLFIANVNTAGGFQLFDIPPVVDIEVTYLTVESIRTWIDLVEQASGMKPIIYTNANYSDKYLTGPEFRDCKLWYAIYGNDHPADRNGWTEWTFFQYTDKGQIPGINSYVDLNEFCGGEEELFGYKLSADTANAMIQICKTHYELAVTTEEKNAWHTRANELRKASGQDSE